MTLELRKFADIEREALAAKVAQIERGVDSGMTFRDVAKACGTTPSTITRTAKLGGLRIERRLSRE